MLYRLTKIIFARRNANPSVTHCIVTFVGRVVDRTRLSKAVKLTENEWSKMCANEDELQNQSKLSTPARLPKALCKDDNTHSKDDNIATRPSLTGDTCSMNLGDILFMLFNPERPLSRFGANSEMNRNAGTGRRLYYSSVRTPEWP